MTVTFTHHQMTGTYGGGGGGALGGMGLSLVLAGLELTKLASSCSNPLVSASRVLELQLMQPPQLLFM